MGLLDEAIREHLQLKRKHGASDDELQSQEQEALGPARREPVPPPPELHEASAELGVEPSATELAESPVEQWTDPAAPPEPVAGGETAPHGFEALEDEPPAYADDADEADYDDYDEGDEGDEALQDSPRVAYPEDDTAVIDDATALERAPEPVGFGDVQRVEDPAGFERIEEPPALDDGERIEEPPALDDVERIEEPLGPDDIERAAPPAGEEQENEGEEDVLEETPEFLQETPEHDRLWFEQKPPRDFDFDE